MSKIKRGERGVAVFETVLALPFIALLTWGLCEMTLVYQKSLQLDLVCFRAVRAAIVHHDEEERSTAIREAIKDAEITFEQKTSSETVAVGTTIELHLRYAYLPPVALGSVPIPLRATCALTSESGAYVHTEK